MDEEKIYVFDGGQTHDPPHTASIVICRLFECSLVPSSFVGDASPTKDLGTR